MSEATPTNKNADALALLRELTSAVVARIGRDGTLRDANRGFHLAASLPETPSSQAVVGAFLQPSFAQLVALSTSVEEALVYQGILNLGQAGATAVSLKGCVYRQGDELLIVAEHDLAEWQQMNDAILNLNEDLAGTQRQLVRDIQARKRAERELQESNRGLTALHTEIEEKARSLQRVSEQKSRFLSYLSHEFRTPLSAIMNLSHILLDRIDGELTAEQETQVTLMLESAQTLLEMVNDQLDLAKIEAGKTRLRRDTFELVDLFAALRGMFRPLVPASVVLVFEEPNGIPPLCTDEGKMAQILRNFIANALKFTSQGEVRVRAVREGDKEVIVTVADSGIGIAPADQQFIFEEFAQVEGAAARQGTGLGLPLSRRLARLLGGDVAVQSTPGVGSTFSLRLPLQYNGPEEVAETALHLAASRSSS